MTTIRLPQHRPVFTKNANPTSTTGAKPQVGVKPLAQGFNRDQLQTGVRQMPQLSAHTQAGVGSTYQAQLPAKGLQNANGAKPVDFNKLSQDQQYDYLQKLTTSRAGNASAWKTGDREVNLVGIRSFNGSPQKAKIDQYDDMIYVARMVDGKKTVEGFPASVDAGADPKNPNASYRLDDGFYDGAFKRGTVSGKELGLRQARDLSVYQDLNKDGALSADEIAKGKTMLSADKQLQFHRGGSGFVGDSSAGCQVIDAQHYDRFQAILKEAPNSQGVFNYTLSDCSRLPRINADGSAQKTHQRHGQYGKYRASADGTSDGIGRIRQPYFGTGGRYSRKNWWS